MLPVNETYSAWPRSGQIDVDGLRKSMRTTVASNSHNRPLRLGETMLRTQIVVLIMRLSLV